MATSFSSRLDTAPEEAVKAPCVVAATANITLSGEQTISGVAVVAGDRVLVAGQTDATENGIYDVAASSWSRSTDWNDGQDVVNGQLVSVPTALYEAAFSGAFSPGTTSVAFTELTTLKVINKTRYELGTSAAAASHVGIITGHVIETSYQDGNRTIGPPAILRFTGTTTAGKATNWPNADGYFYDGDGKQFERANNVVRYGTADFSFQMGSTYGSIDATVTGSYIFDGTSDFPNKLGINNTRPVSEPPAGARSDDTLYVAGVANVSAILGGYDNVANSAANMIASQHSMIYALSDHASIWGGSLNTIETDCVYSVCLGGIDNTIGVRGRYAAIIAGDQNLIETGATDALSGFRSIILGGTQNVAGGRNAVILGGLQARIDSQYGTIINGDNVTLTDGLHAVVSGLGGTVGAAAPAAYSVVHGLNHVVDAARCLVTGEGHIVGSGHDYSSAHGLDAKTPVIGSHVYSARQRDGVIGNNQALSWTASQETTDTTITRLSIASSANYPAQPADSIVNGTVYVMGVNEADGSCGSWEIAVTSERVGTAIPTLRHNVTTERYDGISIVTVPTMNVTTSGIYRVQVVGVAATNINWDAVFYGHQIVYTA